MRHRTLAAITTTALLVALTAGCWLNQGGPAQVRFSVLTVPAELAPSEVTVDQAGLLAADGDAPWSVYAIRRMPRGHSRAVIWAARGDTLPTEPVDFDRDIYGFGDLSGDVKSLVVAGSAKLTVAAIGISVNGDESTVVRRSFDRRTWTDPHVPIGDADVAAVAVHGREALIVGTDRATGDLVGVTLTAGGQTGSVEMPRSPDGVHATLHLQAAAMRGDEIAVVTRQDRGGESDVVSVFRTNDRGATWVEDVIDGDHVRVAGIAATEQGFVLTGHVRAIHDARVLTRASVWTASVGTRGFTRMSDPWTDISADVWVGAPAPTGRGYRYLIRTPSATQVALFDQDGTLIVAGDDRPESGMYGPTAVDADGTVRVVAAGMHGATVFVVHPERSGTAALVPVAVLAPPQRWFTPYRQVGGGVLTAGMRRVEDGWDGSRDVAVQRRYVLEMGPFWLIPAPDDGVSVGERGWRVDASGPDGEVAVVSGVTGSGDVAESVSWARQVGGEWERGPQALAAASTGTPVWVAGQWLLPVMTARSIDVDSPDTAALWASSDGLTWNAVDGFPDTAGQVSMVCALGEQDAIVLGSDHGDPQMWVRSRGTWQTSPATAEGRRTPMGCHVAADGSTVIRFAEGDGVRLLATTDGVTMDEVLATGDRSGIGAVRSVPGGFAAAGWVRDAGGQDRAVIWVSTDGLTWHHVDGPQGEDSVDDLTVIDGTAVVMTDDDRGTRAWIVFELEQYLRELSTKMDP